MSVVSSLKPHEANGASEGMQVISDSALAPLAFTSWVARMLLQSMVVAFVLITTSGCWMSTSSLENGDDEHAGDHEPPDVITLSDYARQSMNIEVRALKRSDYAKTVRIPGQIVKIPGVTAHQVTAKSSGEIEKIHVLEGQLVGPGEPLFDIKLIHEEAILSQLELIDALAKSEVVSAEIARLEKLQTASPGAVAGTRLLTQYNELGHLKHTISSRRQILLLLGVGENDVTALIESHRQQHSDRTPHKEGDEPEPKLIERVRVFAPDLNSSSTGPAAKFVLERLSVQLGEHVDVGNTMCELADLSRLHIRGDVFERDLVAVRKAKGNEWSISAVIQQRADRDIILDDLKVIYVDPMIDPESRSAHFYVELINKHSQSEKPSKEGYAQWHFLPGQRVELRIPVQHFKQKMIVPAEAVARDGMENYIFQASGKTMVRRPITVLYRDEDRVVLSEQSTKIYENKSVALNGAYQLQLSLLNRSRGPVQHSHGGGAAHSH